MEFYSNGLRRPFCRAEQFRQLLEQARWQKQVVYLWGAAGTGKTRSVRKYLEENGIVAYPDEFGTVACPDETGERGEPDLVEEEAVVIDPLIPDTDPQSQQFVRGLITSDKWVLLISRGPIPEWLQDLHLQHPFMIIGGETLLLNYKEIKDLFAQYGISPGKNILETVQKETQGYPAAVTIAAESYRKDSETEDWMRETRQSFYQYLNYRICSTMSREEISLLNAIACLGKFPVTAGTAEEISGLSDCHRLLEKLTEKEGFLFREKNGYTLHSMEADFFRWKAEFETEEEKRTFYQRFGRYYAKKKDYINALDCFEKCGNEDAVFAILIRNVEQHQGVGKYYELRRYYFSISEKKIKTSVVLMCGMSMIYSLLVQIEKSEYWYRNLEKYAARYPKGTAERKEAESRLAYLDIALPHRGSRNVLQLMSSMSKLIKDRQIRLPEFCVTGNQPSIMNGGKDFCGWSKSDRMIARVFGKTLELILGKYGVGLVNIALGESLYEKGESLEEVISYMNRGRYQAETDGKIEICFAAVGILARCYCIRGKNNIARELLLSFRERVVEEHNEFILPNLDALLCRIALRMGDWDTCEQWMKTAPNSEVSFFIMNRYLYMTKVRILAARKEYERAMLILDKMRCYAENYERTYLKMEVTMFQAICLYQMGQNKWQELLDELLREAEEYHFIRLLSEEGALIRPLLAKRFQRRRPNEFQSALLREIERISAYDEGQKKKKKAYEELTETERKVLALLAEGKTAVCMAEMLYVSPSTVRFHCRNIYRKLNVSGKTEAVVRAKEYGLI